MLSDEDLQRSAPFPIVATPGARVSESWQELRQRPGVVPVLVGNRDAVSFVLKELARNTDTPEGIAQRARQLDVDAWLAQRVRSNPELYAITTLDVPWDGAKRPIRGFLPGHDHRGEPYDEVFFALIPADPPWLVPAHLRTAGWGNCPDAVVHTAICRRWYERWGAVITTIADGVVELHVERPPATMEVARELAIEHFVYCPDTIYEGVRTIGNLAGSLLDSPLWYFWWALGDHEP